MKSRELMTEEELAAERERVKMASRQTRARQKAKALRKEGREDEALQVLRDVGLNEKGERIEQPPTPKTLKLPDLPPELANGDGLPEFIPDDKVLVPLAEYREAGELIGTLTTIFRLGLDPDAILSGEERSWLEAHPFGAAVVEERMVLRGLADAYEVWASAVSL